MRSWCWTTCWIASRGSSEGSSFCPSGWSRTSGRATRSSSASGSSPRSSTRACRETRPSGSSSGTPCARGTRDATSASSSGRTRRSPRGSTSTPSSTSRPTPVMWRPCSSGSAPSHQRRNRFMPDVVHVGSGKVRELYALDDERLLLVASDRISTFDVVLATEIPDKGRVLTGLSGFWFARTSQICPNHLLRLRDDARSTECRRLEMLPIECVVRGYITGSGWKDYLATGEVCGHRLAEGLVESQQLPEPIFTPSTKATSGHDENIDRAAAVELI